MTILGILCVLMAVMFFIILISYVLSKRNKDNEDDDIIKDILDEPVDGVITAETTYIHTN